MLNRGRRYAELCGRLADATESFDHLESVGHDQTCTTFASFGQYGRTKYIVAPTRRWWQATRMLRQSDILAELIVRGITQGEIADALGIARPNANKLFKPAAKTGKTRTLTYDEGVMLIERFGLDRPEPAPVEPMAVPVARLAVQYVAQQLGVKIDPDDERVEDLAQDIRAYSEFVASAQVGENRDKAQGWLDGRRSRSQARS